MRAYRGRLGWAVGISLTCHALLAGVFFLAFPGGQAPLVSSSSAADITLAAPADFEPLTVSLDDPPPRIRPQVMVKAPATLPEFKAAPNASSKVEPVEPASASTDSSVKPAVPNEAIANGAVGIAPLHGRLTRPGLSVVYVLDCSGSMGHGGKLAHAVGILKSSLRQLGPDVRFQIVTYDRQAVVMRLAGAVDLVAASGATIAQAESLLNELSGEGSSRHAEGLKAGLGLHPDLLILVSDAGDLSTADVKQIRQWNQKGSIIHAVLLGAAEGKSAASLRELAGPERVRFVAPPDQPLLGP